jgi:hypothetical protein
MVADFMPGSDESGAQGGVALEGSSDEEEGCFDAALFENRQHCSETSLGRAIVKGEGDNLFLQVDPRSELSEGLPGTGFGNLAQGERTTAGQR